MPDTTNDGAIRGTVCHLVFEMLLHEKHRRHYDLILLNDGIQGSAAVNRLVIKKLNEYEAFTQENYDMCSDMITLGLGQDFFGEGGELSEPEIKFELTKRSPKYKALGFIDKITRYEEEGIVKITDYKSSKNKFRGEELTTNVQAMMYSLASKKLWPKLKPVVEFLFLRFPRSPIQRLEYTNAQLKGFEHYLSHIYDLMVNFTENDAKSNYAYNNKKNKWLCAAGKTWVCPMRDPFTYYVIRNKEGKIKKSSFSKDELKPDKKEDIEKIEYDGCPKFHGENKLL
jgi:hypothetical protein